MTEADLRRIQTELGIELPESYRETMLTFAIPACAGNDDTELWDDPDALIARNQEYRQGAPGGVKPWPVHLFFVGDGGSGCAHAIDLRSPDAAVWWVDHGHLDLESSGEIEPSFSDWADAYLRDLRDDLEGDGIEPDHTPDDRERVETRNARESVVALVVVIAVVTIFLIGIAAIVSG